MCASSGAEFQGLGLIASEVVFLAVARAIVAIRMVI